MMPMSGSPGGGGGARAQRATGSSTTMAEFCSTVTGRVASPAQGNGSADQRNLAAFTTLFIVTRARGAPPRQRSSRRCRRCATSPISFSVSTMELARAGRPTMMPMSGSPGGGGGARAQRATGSSTTMAEFCSTVTGRVASPAQGNGSADQRNLAAFTTLFIVTRARGAPPRQRSSRRCRRCATSPISFSVSTMESRAGRPTMMPMSGSPGGGGGARAQRATGSSTTMAEFCSTVTGRVASPAQRQRLGRSAEFGRVHHSLHRYARARRAATTAVEPPVPALRDVADFFFAIRFDDGARARGATDDDADVGFAWWGRRRSSAASYGVIDNDGRILQHCHWSGSLARARQRLGRSAEFGRVHHSLHRYARARRAATTAVEPPVPALLDVADFFFGFDDGVARAGRPTMMPMSGSPGGGGGARAQRATGSSTTMAEFCSTVTGRVASPAQGNGSADQRNLAAFTTLFIVTRARGAPPRQRSSRRCRRCSTSPISFSVSTMELGARGDRR